VSRTLRQTTFLLTLLLATGAAAPAQTAPEMRARLLTDRESLAPGTTVTLAIEVEVTPGWHYYHPILLGGSGLPTTIEFDLSDAVTVGELQFPTPTLGTVLDQEYLGYEGRIVVLTTLTCGPKLQPGGTVRIGADVSGLACIDQCVLVGAAAELSLPVSTQPGAPANGELFEAARAKLPPKLSDAPHLQGSRLVVSHEKLPIGTRGEIALLLSIEPEHHIQDADPGTEMLVPSRVFLESIDGLVDGAGKPFGPSLLQHWPPARVRDMPGIGKVREQAGQVAVRIPFQVSDENFEARYVRGRALLQYQCCTDAGVCFQPVMAEASYEFDVVPRGQAPVASQEPVFREPITVPSGSHPPLIWVLLGAFVGGAILNVMPCVLPVLSLKIFSFMQQAGESRSRVVLMGLMYTVGVLSSFAVLAAVMVRFGLAWGGLMQHPLYVEVFIALVLAFALSLMGVWELRLPGIIENVAGAATTREGFVGAFLNGVMATALATPCVGPYLGWAIGILVQLPPWLAATGIMTVGLGLASPYLVLTAFPGWLRFLPRPGHWMVTFKQLMGFVLVGTAIWLLWILHTLVPPLELIALLCALVFVGLGCWVIGQLPLSASRRREALTWSAAVACIVVGWQASFWYFQPSVGLNWEPWSPGLPERLAREGHSVYVDFTATWCLTCQTNKNVVLERDPVRAKLLDLGVRMIKADFTRANDPLHDAIQAELRKYGRAGVPLNIILGAQKPDQPIVLPELLTAARVLEDLDRAGPSRARGNTLSIR
jgi:thiol:disulfide interchange protein/DsbC/DsbD-like thiol-disulfide interchange protein